MKVLFIARYYLPRIGGVEKHVFEITKKLKNKNLKINIVCEQTKGTGKRDTIDGVTVYRIKFPRTKLVGLFFIWCWFWKHRKLIKEADIIHCHDVVVWYLPFRFLYPKKPLYATFHGWEGIFPIPFKYKFIRKITAYIVKGNICVGKYIEKWYGVKASYLIHGGVSDLLLSSSHLPFVNSKKILYLGRLDEDTGIKTYLDAFKILRTRIPGIRFEFLGGGKYRKEAERIGTVHGFQDKTEDFIKDSRFVCTSGYLSMLEAISLKRLVFSVSENPIKFDILILSPFSRNTIHTNNPETLAKKIEFFLKNPKLEKRILEKAHTWAMSQTWDNVAKKYLNLWKIEK